MGAEYCDQFVCLCVSVCLSTSISLELLYRSSRIFVQIPCGRGSVLLWRRCDTGSDIYKCLVVIVFYTVQSSIQPIGCKNDNKQLIHLLTYLLTYMHDVLLWGDVVTHYIAPQKHIVHVSK